MKLLIYAIITVNFTVGIVHKSYAQELEVKRITYNYQPRQLKLYNSGLDTLHFASQPSIFNRERLPFFCKYEYNLDLQIPLKVRFRLGSLDYVNRLEGKY